MAVVPDVIIEPKAHRTTLRFPNGCILLEVQHEQDSGLLTLDIRGYHANRIYLHEYQYKSFISSWSELTIFDDRWKPLFRSNGDTTHHCQIFLTHIVDRIQSDSSLCVEILSIEPNEITYGFVDMIFTLSEDGFLYYLEFDDIKIKTCLTTTITLDEAIEMLFPTSVLREWKLKQLTQ
jgi:hypothetical protein